MQCLWEGNCGDGRYEIRHPKKSTALYIAPESGHWSHYWDIEPDVDTVQCKPIITGGSRPWWQRVVGVDHRSSARGMKIGIIDHVFPKTRALSHVTIIDEERRVPSVRAALMPHARVHGQQIATMLAGSTPKEWRGIARDAGFYFVDATLFEDGAIVPERVDDARVRNGIEVLSLDYGVDLINLSCGFGQQDRADLEDSVEEAADHGTLCICAAGNSSGPPEIPAAFHAAIGVAGVGFTEVCPDGTILHAYGMEASTGKNFPGFGHAFANINSAKGEGIDVCGPGIGIVIPTSKGVADFHGTSYASPIVTGVLACRLMKDKEYHALKGRQRYERAKNVLFAMVRDLGLEISEMGRGMPYLQL